MFAQIAYPERILPEALDKYLANGWFRMRQTIFTTNFLHFNQQFYSAIWLRVALAHYVHDKKYLTLYKLNKGFRNEIKKTSTQTISAQHEILYQQYRQSVSFDVSASLQELLFGNQNYNRFDTFEVNIFDGETMIAAGFFDLGKTSAAGIASIYHPAYKKYSLGKYLIYLKIEFCKQHRFEYFYPGYMVPGYMSFDYKLDIGKASLEYMELSTSRWQPYLSLELTPVPMLIMYEKLVLLNQYLIKNKIPNSILYYKFFEANLDPYYQNDKLFDFPVFLYCALQKEESLYVVVVYDVRDNQYHLLHCNSIINIGFQHNGSKIFESDLLKVRRKVFSTSLPREIFTRLSSLFNVI